MDHKTLPIRGGEYFARTRRWWVIFGLLATMLLVLTLFSNMRARGGSATVTVSDIVNTGLLAILMLGYVVITQRNASTKQELSVTDNGLRIGDQLVKRRTLQGFVLEINTDTETIWNIVLIYQHGHTVYTIRNASQEHIESFVGILQDYIDMLSDYEQSFIEKMMRKIML